MKFLLKKHVNILLICLLIYFAVIPMQLSNYVLCIGEDGHIEVEAATHGRCCPDARAAHTEIATEQDHCGACVDLPIFSSLNTEQYVVSSEHAAAHDSVCTSAVLITHQPGVSPTLTVPSLLTHPPFINPKLISLRTVILLI